MRKFFKYLAGIVVLTIIIAIAYAIFARPHVEQTRQQAEQHEQKVFEEIYRTETGESLEGKSEAEIEQLKQQFGF